MATGKVDISVVLDLLGGDKLTNALDRAGKSAETLGKRFASMRTVGLAGITAIGGAIGGAVARFSDLQAGLATTQGMLNETSFGAESLAEGMQGFTDSVIDLRAKTGQSFDSLTQGLQDLIGSGVKTGDAIGILTTAAKLATAGTTDTDIAIKGLVATMTGFTKETFNAEQAAAKFYLGQQYGLGSVGDLASYLNVVAGAASGVGVSFTETLGAMAAMTNNGAKPVAQATTELNALFSKIVAVQSDVIKTGGRLKEIFSLEAIEANGLQKSLEDLYAYFGGDPIKIFDFFKEQNAISAFTSLANGQKDVYKQIIAAMDDTEGAAKALDNAYKAQADTISFKTKQMAGSVDALTASLGGAFAPTIILISDSLQGFLNALSAMDERLVNILAGALILGGALAALLVVVGAVGSGVAVVVGGLATFLPVVAGVAAAIAGLPFAALVGIAVALGAALALVVLNFDAIKGFLVSLPSKIIDFVEFLGKEMGSGFAGVRAAFDNLVQAVIAGFPKLASAILGALGNVGWLLYDLLIQPFVNLKDYLVSIYTEFVDTLRDLLMPLFDTLGDWINRLGNAINRLRGAGGGGSGDGPFEPDQGFSVGGIVRGPGTRTSDSIPARLSDGEFVMRAAAVDAIGIDWLNALNTGEFDLEDMLASQLSGFADGGLATAIGSQSAPTDSLPSSGGAANSNNLSIVLPSGERIEASQNDAQARGTRAVALRSKRRRPHGAPSWVG